MSHLTRIVPLAQDTLAEVLHAGDSAIDLTAGNGHDTLILRQRVGNGGTVFSFDLQVGALHNTALRLQEAGFSSTLHSTPLTTSPPGVHLIAAGHECLSRYVTFPVRAIIANLGYLPGGDKQMVTRPETTLSALQQAMDLLLCGGRLAVVVYTGHPGGQQEAVAVDQWFASLDSDSWNVLRTDMPNRSAAPYLLVAEKR